MTTSRHTGLAVLLAPVPPMLERTWGYAGNARFLGACWSPPFDRIWLCDSNRQQGIAEEWESWIQYTSHPRIEPYLAPFEFGDAGIPTVHWFFLDRLRRQIAVGTEADVLAALEAEVLAPPCEPSYWCTYYDRFIEVKVDSYRPGIKPEEVESRRRRIRGEVTGQWLDGKLDSDASVRRRG